MSRTAVIGAFAVVAAVLGYLSIWRPLANPEGAGAARHTPGYRSVASDVQRGYALVQTAGGERDVLMQAAQLFARAAEADPESAEAWFGWGWALQLLGDERGAEPRYLRATALAEGDPHLADTAYFTAYNLAVVYTSDLRHLEALGALERASTLRPTQAEVWARMGRLLLEIGAAARAVTSLEKAAALGDSTVHQELARARDLAR